MKVRAYITHKLAEEYSDCQDRFCINKESCRIAVSDGMGQSIFPDYWAGILSTFYAFNGRCSNDDRKLLCAEWLEKVNTYYDQQIAIGKNPWMLRNNLVQKNGAGATLCGVTFLDEQKWTGHVLGDTCAIEIDKESKCPLRIISSEEKPFDCYPDYYDSYPEKDGRGKIREVEGVISENKILLIASDPFSEFFQKNRDNCEEIIKQILSLDSHESFCEFVDYWRQHGLHNDDSTLCIIEYDGSTSMDIVHEDNIEELISNSKEQVAQSVPEQIVACPEEHESSTNCDDIDAKKDLFAEEMTRLPKKQENNSNTIIVEESVISKQGQKDSIDQIIETIKEKLDKLKKEGNLKVGKIIKMLKPILSDYCAQSKNDE